MKQIIASIWQHSPSTIQVQSNPVKEVEKTMSKLTPTTTSWEDLRGLSWVFSESDDILDYEEEMFN